MSTHVDPLLEALAAARRADSVQLSATVRMQTLRDQALVFARTVRDQAVGDLSDAKFRAYVHHLALQITEQAKRNGVTL